MNNIGTKLTNKIQGYAESAVATPLAFLVRIMLAIATLIGAAVLLATFAQYAGFRVPFVKVPNTTELAYAMVAYLAFRWKQ